MIGTSLASLSRPLWRLVERYLIDPDFVFRRAGLDPTLMNEPRARYEAQGVEAAWAAAAGLIDDPCFGLRIAETWSPTDLHALGIAVLASSSVRTALKRVARYTYVVDNAIGFDLADDGERVSLTLAPTGPSLAAAEEDATWALTISLCRTISGAELNPTEIRLRHQAPSCRDDYDGFFRCPILFDAAESSIAFSCADADRPVPAPNRELARANDEILATFLAELQGDDLIPRVKAAIADELPSGSPRDELIAKVVHMSARTLRRRLAAEGTTYSKILDSVRRELAEKYINDPEHTLSEIAFLLGFSELSAFSRAFKRWTGEAPSAFREPPSG